MRSSILTALMLLVNQLCMSAVIHVPDDQPTIQAGIDSAVTGDTVLVADGLYAGEGNRDIDYGGRIVVVKSENGPEHAVVDCGGSQQDPHRGFWFHRGETSSAVLDGFTVRGGYGPYDSDGESVGGGLKCDSSSSPTLISCILDQNYYGKHGGGIYCENSAPTLINCTFIANRSLQTMLGHGNGSGIYCENSEPALTGCAFVGNVAGLYGDGGAMCCVYSAPTLSDCTFSGNSAGGVGGKGGGVYSFSSFLTMQDCILGGNHAEYGGGVHCWGDSATLTGCTFSKNVATYDTQDGGWGGGLNCWACSVTLTNCTFSANDANPIPGWYGFGSALSVDGSSVSMENCIIAFSPESDPVYCHGSLILLACTDVFGNAAGDWIGCIADQADIRGNFSLDPEFCDTTAEDYRLTSTSPCLPDNSECGVLVGSQNVGCGLVCGDVDASGAVDIDDVVYLISYIFSGGPEPLPYHSGDTNCSGAVDIDDPVYLIAYILSGGYAPCDADGDGEPDC